MENHASGYNGEEPSVEQFLLAHGSRKPWMKKEGHDNVEHKMRRIGWSYSGLKYWCKGSFQNNKACFNGWNWEGCNGAQRRDPHSKVWTILVELTKSPIDGFITERTVLYGHYRAKTISKQRDIMCNLPHTKWRCSLSLAHWTRVRMGFGPVCSRNVE